MPPAVLRALLAQAESWAEMDCEADAASMPMPPSKDHRVIAMCTKRNRLRAVQTKRLGAMTHSMPCLAGGQRRGLAHRFRPPDLERADPGWRSVPVQGGPDQAGPSAGQRHPTMRSAVMIACALRRSEHLDLHLQAAYRQGPPGYQRIPKPCPRMAASAGGIMKSRRNATSSAKGGGLSMNRPREMNALHWVCFM